MGKISEKLLTYWLAVPRQVRVFCLSLFTSCFFGYMIYLGIKRVLQFHTLNRPETILCGIVSLFILFALNHANNGKNTGGDDMKIVSTKDLPKRAVSQFFTTHWGSPVMVNSNGTFQCDELEGYAVLDENREITGLITFIINGTECEIISLDSIIENNGIGSALLKEVERASEREQCEQVKLITTNDNVRAIGFYQKRGYVLAGLFVNAVEKARKIKPGIPFTADNGIPIRDEILLVKRLT